VGKERADPLLSPGFKDEINHNRFGAQQLQQKETKYLSENRKENKRKERKKKHTCTLLCPKMETSRAHSSATEGEDQKRGAEEQIEGFPGYPAPIISCLQPPIYPLFFHLFSSSHALFLLFPN
jgi:hypothetical protein